MEKQNLKVLLVDPPTKHRLDSSVSKELDKKREFRQSLGLLYVAAAAEKVEGVEVAILDCDAEMMNVKEYSDYLKTYKPDIVGITALTFTVANALIAAREAKNAAPNTKICIGGIHATYYPHETLSNEFVDFVFAGEGEEPFRMFLEAVLGGASLDDVPGLGYKENGRIILNAQSKVPYDVNDIEMPAHHLIDLKKYTHILGKGGVVCSIQATRGCPYGCLFCDIRKTKFRQRSIENVMSEIKYLVSSGVKDFFFADDTITVNKKWLIELCDAIVRENLGISFKISSRVNTISIDMVTALKKAGCKRINFGVETGSQRLLEYLQKGIKLEQTTQAFKVCYEAGVDTFAYAMIGIPTETKEEIYATERLIKSLKALYVSYSICTPYPKTALYQKMLDEKIISHDYWAEFARHPSIDFQVPFCNKNFSDAELRSLQSKLMRRFYSSPSFILREIRNTKSMSHFWQKAKVGLKILSPFKS